MKKLYINNTLGAGDHANFLPVLNFLSAKYIVYTDIASTNENLYKNSIINKYSLGLKPDLKYVVYYENAKNIPATDFLENSKLISTADLSSIRECNGIIFTEEEKKDLLSKEPYVNIFSYSTIRQKRINLKIVEKIVNYIIDKKRLKVFTSIPEFDGNNSSRYKWNSIRWEYFPATPYFSRDWVLHISGAFINICGDGGPFNVSLASKNPNTIGLLTIADKSLALFYNENKYSIVQSTVKCSPCFNPANYDTCEVYDCVNPINICGDNFNIDEIIAAIDRFC